MNYKGNKIVLTLIVAAALLVLGKCVADFIEVDRCIDAGGVWNEGTKTCRL